jgi:hypothetical protein
MDVIFIEEFRIDTLVGGGGSDRQAGRRWLPDACAAAWLPAAASR